MLSSSTYLQQLKNKTMETLYLNRFGDYNITLEKPFYSDIRFIYQYYGNTKEAREILNTIKFFRDKIEYKIKRELTVELSKKITSCNPNKSLEWYLDAYRKEFEYLTKNLNTFKPFENNNLLIERGLLILKSNPFLK